jgi:hypothetical protein
VLAESGFATQRQLRRLCRISPQTPVGPDRPDRVRVQLFVVAVIVAVKPACQLPRAARSADGLGGRSLCDIHPGLLCRVVLFPLAVSAVEAAVTPTPACSLRVMRNRAESGVTCQVRSQPGPAARSNSFVLSTSSRQVFSRTTSVTVQHRRSGRRGGPSADRRS